MDDQIWEALTSVQLRPTIERLPHGIDTQLGEQWGGVGLSGGQWQRLALARVFLRNSGIWILDEPTSAVDAAAEVGIMDAIVHRPGASTAIVVSHRAWTLRGVDYIYYLLSVRW